MDAPGRDEEAVIVHSPAPGSAVLTHRDLLAMARATVLSANLGPATVSHAPLTFSDPLSLTALLLAPLLAGGRVITTPG